MSSDDHLILEDESGRVKLAGPMLGPSAFVTGYTYWKLNGISFGNKPKFSIAHK
jgi:DNA polymerase delta subunit OB-fold domain